MIKYILNNCKAGFTADVLSYKIIQQNKKETLMLQKQLNNVPNEHFR